MSAFCKLLSSSLGKKYIMATTGLVLVLFVFGHMLGNLQVFLPPEFINAYAKKLHDLGPVLWLIRLFLLGCVVAHIVTAVQLVIANNKARPNDYQVKQTVQATLASRTMALSGSIVLFFIVFHLMQFTIRTGSFSEYNELKTTLHGESAQDVHAMMIQGFQNPIISVFYVIAVGLLCAHLSHGVSSMFQSLGLRNRVWRSRLTNLAKAYGVIIFLGFAAVPVGVLTKVVKAPEVPSATAETPVAR